MMWAAGWSGMFTIKCFLTLLFLKQYQTNTQHNSNNNATGQKQLEDTVAN
jgi:hypothetical protein